jgi:GNAT superfamily N-acetyltransferase
VTVRVRRLETKDKVAWSALFRAYIEFYRASVPEEVIETTWRRLHAREDGMPIAFVAVDAGDTPIGIAHVLFHRSTWSATWYCYLEDLFVSPSLRANGVGRLLIEAVYAEADARDCTRTYWMTEEANYRARGLYDQMAMKSPFVQYRR